MLKVVIAENSLDSSSWETFETENLIEFIMQKFEKWPSSARIYHESVSEFSDITPSNEKEVELLTKLQGKFYIVVYPQETLTIISVIVAVLAVAAVVFLKPKIPVVALRNQENPSSNNSLSNRVNKERINSRIPDIYGQIRSVPDLISLPYKTFENNVEIENSYMCIGRGEFQIDDIREDTTLISEIEGTCVEVYGPNTSPNSGTPQLTIGQSINEPILKVSRLNSVNGQVLDPDQKEQIFDSCKFTHTKRIVSISSFDFSSIFSIGDSIEIEAYEFEETFPGSGEYITVGNFSGIYEIFDIFPGEIEVIDVSASSRWEQLVLLSEDSEFLSTKIQNENSGFTGPFFIDRIDTEEIWFNFVAPNGIYKDNGSSREPFPISILVKITPVDALGAAIGPEEEFVQVLQWNPSNSFNVGSTLKAVPTFLGRSKVFVRRTTPKIIQLGYQIQQEVQFRDLYAIASVDKDHFGNITTIQSKTVSNEKALSVKERKLNCLVTRKLPARISGETFSSALYPTKRADEIISAICLDKFIGNRQKSEIDFDNIYSTIAEIETYFGTSLATEFSYTFDSSNLSFEEILYSLANSIFCIAYRRGNKIKLSFEKENDTSTILFNHRNKIPGTEVRSVSFGNASENDGIEYQYIDSSDESVISIYLPEDQSAVNPSVIESIGVRNEWQAHFNARRLYNKLLYKNLSVEFEATQESNICVINDRILISDGTRNGSIEGEIVNVNALELELSQEADLRDGVEYTIFLQYSDGTVESIPITKTAYKNKIVLNEAPLMPLVTNYNNYAKTTFVITSNEDPRKTAFILVEKSPKGTMTSELKAVNYDARYYQNDKDFINA